jgi:hypothetical protein
LKETAVIAGLQTIVLFVSDVERAARFLPYSWTTESVAGGRSS